MKAKDNTKKQWVKPSVKELIINSQTANGKGKGQETLNKKGDLDQWLISINMNFHLEFSDKLICYKTPDVDLSFSGEIYNLDELAIKHQLYHLNYTELFAKLFEKNGSTFYEELNGIFLLFIHNKQKNELEIIRDHLGLHPLFYTRKNDTFYFSDYDLNLCSFLNLSFDELNIDYFLSNLKVFDYHLTLHPSIKSIKYGHYLKLNLKTGEIKEVEFWNPLKANALKLKAEEIVALAEQKIRKAIHIRNKTFEKKGFHISGGIDCSTITAIVQEENFQENSYGFSWSPEPKYVYTNLEFDERLLVKKACNYLKLEPYFSEKKFPPRERSLDPRFSVEQELAVLEKAKQENIKLIYSGYGGDEFISAPFFGLKITQMKELKFSKIFNRKKSLKKNIGNFLKEIMYPFFGIIPKRKLKEYQEFVSYLKSDFQKVNTKLLKKDFCYSSRRVYHMNSLERGHLSYNVSTLNYIGNQFNITYSFPLLDKDLVSFIFQLNDKELSKLVENRPLLRTLALKLLPHEVASHKRKTDPAINEQTNLENQKLVMDFLNCFHFQEANYLKKFFNFDKLQIDSNHFKKNTFENVKQKEGFIATILCLSYINEFKKYYEIYTK
jgi:asparagine synthase (glutamine-hydrolysing)